MCQRPVWSSSTTRIQQAVVYCCTQSSATYSRTLCTAAAVTTHTRDGIMIASDTPIRLSGAVVTCGDTVLFTYACTASPTALLFYIICMSLFESWQAWLQHRIWACLRLRRSIQCSCQDSSVVVVSIGGTAVDYCLSQNMILLYTAVAQQCYRLVYRSRLIDAIAVAIVAECWYQGTKQGLGLQQRLRTGSRPASYAATEPPCGRGG